jgi:glycogen debranching enzyme
MNKIQDNFEKHFWIGLKEEVYSTDKFINKKLILNEDIYKDVDMCSNHKSEYQLRPNYLIAMAVAPELFVSDHAIKALKSVEKYLIVNDGLGVRTLSPNDRFYNGDYINNNDSFDYNLAHGFNYHNVNEQLI